MRSGWTLLALALAACAPATAPQWGEGQGEDLVRNGNFIEGFMAWSVMSTNKDPPSVEVLDDKNCRDPGCEGRSPVGTFASFNGGDEPANAMLSQTVPTRAGTTYILTFSYGAFDGEADRRQTMEVAVSSGLTVLQTADIESIPGSRDLSKLFKNFGLWFVATGETTTLTFIDRSPDSLHLDGLLTQVSLKRR